MKVKHVVRVRPCSCEAYPFCEHSVAPATRKARAGLIPSEETDAARRKVKAKLDDSDLATILAALRLFQKTYEDKDAEEIREEWEHFYDCAPLGTADINELCERINTSDVLELPR